MLSQPCLSQPCLSRYALVSHVLVSHALVSHVLVRHALVSHTLVSHALDSHTLVSHALVSHTLVSHVLVSPALVSPALVSHASLESGTHASRKRKLGEYEGQRTILSWGSMVMEVCRKALSRKGTRGSIPKAKGDLLALATSHRCSLSTFLTVSLHGSPSLYLHYITLHDIVV